MLASGQSCLFRLGQLLCLKMLWRLVLLNSIQRQPRLFIPSINLDLYLAEVTGLAHTSLLTRLLPFEGQFIDSVPTSGRPRDLFPDRNTEVRFCRWIFVSWSRNIYF